MEYKYFLGLEPEEKDIIDPSLLTKFRRNRIAKYEKDENGKLINAEIQKEYFLLYENLNKKKINRNRF